MLIGFSQIKEYLSELGIRSEELGMKHSPKCVILSVVTEGNEVEGSSH